MVRGDEDAGRPCPSWFWPYERSRPDPTGRGRHWRRAMLIPDWETRCPFHSTGERSPASSDDALSRTKRKLHHVRGSDASPQHLRVLIPERRLLSNTSLCQRPLPRAAPRRRTASRSAPLPLRGSWWRSAAPTRLSSAKSWAVLFGGRAPLCSAPSSCPACFGARDWRNTRVPCLWIRHPSASAARGRRAPTLAGRSPRRTCELRELGDCAHLRLLIPDHDQVCDLPRVLLEFRESALPEDRFAGVRSPMPLSCGKDPHAGERLLQLRKRRHAPLNPLSALVMAGVSPEPAALLKEQAG